MIKPRVLAHDRQGSLSFKALKYLTHWVALTVGGGFSDLSQYRSTNHLSVIKQIISSCTFLENKTKLSTWEYRFPAFTVIICRFLVSFFDLKG
jgi:hypothetical protein